MPVLKRIEEYLREQKGVALPKSQFGKAIDYVLNQSGGDARVRKRRPIGDRQ